MSLMHTEGAKAPAADFKRKEKRIPQNMAARTSLAPGLSPSVEHRSQVGDVARLLSLPA